MADTADRRLEGRGAPAKITLQRRERSKRGLCAKCGLTEVVNRKTCYACVDKQVINNMRWYVRRAERLGLVTIKREF